MARQPHKTLADEHHVVRYCNNQRIEKDPHTGNAVGLFPDAMQLRTREKEEYLSTNWLEYVAGTRNDRLKSILGILRGKIPSIKETSGLAVLRVEKIKDAGKETGHKITVRFTPNRNDPSYARILGLPLDNSDTELVSLLVDEAFNEFYLVKQVDALP